MSTPAYAGRLNTDNTVTAIRINWSGYPEGVGRMLLEHYSDPVKIDSLIELGECSTLRPELFPTEPHSFDKPQEGVSIFYGRDRGETDVGNFTRNNIAAYADYVDSYAYLYFKGAWYILKIGKDDRVTQLKLTLKNTGRKD